MAHLRRSGFSFCILYPALTHWANLCRTYGARETNLIPERVSYRYMARVFTRA